MPAAPIIEFDDVSKIYGRAHALERVTLHVGEGEFLAIVGPSGSGKTTLLRLINRLAEPSSGVVRVLHEDVQLADPPLLRRRIGYVFQGIGLFPHLPSPRTSQSRRFSSAGIRKGVPPAPTNC